MNIAILDVKHGNRNPENSITVAYRNLLELKNYLNADLFCSVKDINFKKNYDAVICGFGSMSTEKEYSVKFLKQNDNARLFWLVGEYEQSTFAPLFYCGRKFDIIKNFEHYIKNKKVDQQHFLNINTLLFRNPNEITQKKYDIVYWGRWREDRKEYFKKYLQSGIYISTSSKNMKKYINAGCSGTVVNSMKWDYKREALNNFKYSIYIEDKFTHVNYNCLANRFYEALFCNVVQFFDINCKNTIERSGIDFDDYFYVTCYDDLMGKIRTDNFNNSLEFQKKWVKKSLQEKEHVLYSIKDILTTTGA